MKGMVKMAFNKICFLRLSFLIYSFFIMGCVGENINEKTGNGSLGSISVERYSDNIYQVLKAHRTAYAKLIIQRLTLNHKVIKATERWKSEKALLLPAQMFRKTAHLFL